MTTPLFQPRDRRPGLLVIAALIGLAPWSATFAQSTPQAVAAEADNSGQDPTRPVTRFDLRLKEQDSPGGADSQLLTFRADKPFSLAGGWKLTTRIDVPVVRTDTPAAASSGYKTGLGDVLLQGLLVTPPKGKLAFAFGSQLIVPTGSDDQFTSGKWRLVPTAAAVYQLPDISRGSFVGVLVRDDVSVAGDGKRPDINVASLQPIFNWALPNRWFLTLAPEAKFDTRNGWKLFLPFDGTVGVKINPRTVISLQGDVALVDAYKQYDWQLELRAGFFF